MVGLNCETKDDVWLGGIVRPRMMDGWVEFVLIETKDDG